MHPDKAKQAVERGENVKPPKQRRPLAEADRSGPVVDGKVQTDPPKRYSEDPKDHEHPDLPLDEEGGEGSGG